jgi:AraC family transcriptional regulator
MTPPPTAAPRGLAPRVLPVESVAYRSDLVWIGRFRCPPRHPLFVDCGPASAHLFVFPRTSVRIRHKDQPPFLSTPNNVTFYNPGDEYRRDAVSPEGDDCDWFAVAPEVAAEAVAREDPRAAERPQTTFRFTHGPSDAGSYLRQRLAVHLAAGGGADPLLVEETALRVLCHLLRGAYRERGSALRTRASRAPTLRPRHLDLVEAAQSLLAERLAEPLSLTDLARGVGASVFHLCRLFRRATGRSVHAYREQLRLRRSLEMLTEAKSGITAIALDLGYSSHSHFSFAFRRSFGTTPAAFRDAAGRASRRRGALRAGPP